MCLFGGKHQIYYIKVHLYSPAGAEQNPNIHTVVSSVVSWPSFLKRELFRRQYVGLKVCSFRFSFEKSHMFWPKPFVSHYLASRVVFFQTACIIDDLADQFNGGMEPISNWATQEHPNNAVWSDLVSRDAGSWTEQRIFVSSYPPRKHYPVHKVSIRCQIVGAAWWGQLRAMIIGSFRKHRVARFICL